jgi:exodeoxyribonuclease X
MIVRIFDIETSGLTPETGSVIEIGHSDVTLPARTIGDPVSTLHASAFPITPENRAVHHINPATLLNRPMFDPVAWNGQAEADGVTCLAAFNSDFDAAFLKPTLPVICLYKSALRAWPELTKHSNSAVFYALEDRGLCRGANYAYVTAHRAGPDAYVSAWVFKALLEAGHTSKQMLEWSREPALLPRCPLGKHKGAEWADVPRDYLQWIVRAPDMGADVVFCARRELERRAN